MTTSPQTLSVQERMVVAAWAADCAEHVLGIYQAAAPHDVSLLQTLDQARAFSAGELHVGAAIRSRGGDAGSAAREAPTPAAKAAAYAAEQAAATAHMGAHALGAAGYAVKATVLCAVEDTEEVVSREVTRYVTAMGDGVEEALSSLPALGENTAGPLGPGRLSGGIVGQAIRMIQERLEER